MTARLSWLCAVALAGVVAAVVAVTAAEAPRTYATPEEAVRALTEAVTAGNLDDVIAIFGPEGRDLAQSSEPATGRANRQVFAAAVAEQWHLADAGPNRKILVIGNEEWPFPVPIVKTGARWHFDTAAGKDEVLSRRIGRNELEAITTCRTYVTAQRRYARDAHDGKPAGLYAAKLASDPGRQNGLYWPDVRGQSRSPLGDLVAQAAADGQSLEGRTPSSPFHGYYFRILTAQGAHAAGGARSYRAGGELSKGFALVAWPSQYDATGVMTFLVNQDGIVRQKDLGPDTATRIAAMTGYDPDASWHAVR